MAPQKLLIHIEKKIRTLKLYHIQESLYERLKMKM